ncbi:MAG: DUF3368 domain-containing protein [Spirochaetaceae bacterium]|nr:DUF3368 domain-containing protein [Spirochaetaceae bacterium]
MAKQKGHIAALKPSLDMLMNTGFRISNTLYRDIVGRSGES